MFKGTNFLMCKHQYSVFVIVFCNFSNFYGYTVPTEEVKGQFQFISQVLRKKIDFISIYKSMMDGDNGI